MKKLKKFKRILKIRKNEFYKKIKKIIKNYKKL